MSGRVTSSGNMPPVCSNSVRRSSPSDVPNRAATPGRYQTGSTATLVTEISPVSCRTAPSAFSRLALMAPRISGMFETRLGDRDGRAGCRCRPRSPPRRSRRPCGPMDRARRSCPGSDHCGCGPIVGRRMGVVQVRPSQRIERARRNRQRAIERIGAAMGADHVAVGRVGDRADDRSAGLRISGPPGDGPSGGGGVRLGMRREPDMRRAIGRIHVLDLPRKNGKPLRDRAESLLTIQSESDPK